VALAPHARKAVLATIAKHWRKNQQDRKSFSKLRTKKYLKAVDTKNTSEIEFTGQVQCMAQVPPYVCERPEPVK